MTRSLTILAVLLFAAFIASLVVGFVSVAPAMLIVGLLCAMPMFCLALGAVLGRVSNELTITRRDKPQQTAANRVSRVNPSTRATPEHLS